MQALCDSDYIFRYASGPFGGATHDALAKAVSGFKEKVEGDLLGVVFWLVGDEAYRISKWIITSIPGSTPTRPSNK